MCCCSLQLLKKKYGPRTVPVELGSRYTDDTWSQRLMTLYEFITEYIESPSLTGSSQNATGYLAQHQLFDQVCVRVCVCMWVQACEEWLVPVM